MCQHFGPPVVMEHHRIAIRHPPDLAARTPGCHEGSKRPLIVEFIEQHSSLFLCHFLVLGVERVPYLLHPLGKRPERGYCRFRKIVHKVLCPLVGKDTSPTGSARQSCCRAMPYKIPWLRMP